MYNKPWAVGNSCQKKLLLFRGLFLSFQVNRADGEMPEGAKSTDDEDENTKKRVSYLFVWMERNCSEPK